MNKVFFLYILVLVFISAGYLFFSLKIHTVKINSVPVSDYKLISQVTYQCDGKKEVTAVFYQGPEITPQVGQPPVPSGKVNLVLSDGRQLSLPQTLSGSGIRYANGDESFIFWSKGDTAFIMENNQETYSNCSTPNEHRK